MTITTDTWWWIIGITSILLIVVIVITLAFAVLKGQAVEVAEAATPVKTTSNGGILALAAVLLIVAVVIIIAAIIAYFNGYFNIYKTTPENLALRYDYLSQYKPVDKLLSANMLETAPPNPKKAAFDGIVNDFRTMFGSAARIMLMSKSQVEKALYKVVNGKDTKYLADYEFSTPMIIFARFIETNINVIIPYQDVAIQIMKDSMAAISPDENDFIFVLQSGLSLDLLTIVGMYRLFVQQYPDIASSPKYVYIAQNNSAYNVIMSHAISLVIESTNSLIGAKAEVERAINDAIKTGKNTDLLAQPFSKPVMTVMTYMQDNGPALAPFGQNVDAAMNNAIHSVSDDPQDFRFIISPGLVMDISDVYAFYSNAMQSGK